MSQKEKQKNSSNELKGFYGAVERIGNKIPRPEFMFIWLFIITYIAASILGGLGVAVENPVTGDIVAVVNLLTAQGVADFLQKMGSVWMNFAPLLTVPICTIGLAVASRSGLLENCLKTAGAVKGKWIVTLIVAFIGVNANLVGDAAFVIFPPLMAMLFKSVKRNPLAGLFLGFASVSVGFGANLLMGSADASLAGLTEAAASVIDPTYTANAAMGWYFLFVSTFIVTLVVSWVTIHVIEPKLERTGLAADDGEVVAYQGLNATEKKGLKNALIALVLFFAVVVLFCFDGMPFAAPEDGSITTGMLFKCIPALIMIMFFVPGFVYGKIVGTIHKFGDTIPMMHEEMKTLSGFFIVCLFASQFISIFGASNIASIIAIIGGNFLVGLGLPKAILLGAFVILVGFVNLFMTGASGKWALISTMFVPMFMIAGLNPAAVQVAYRMGDGLTNNISPTLAYLAIILGYAQQYESRAKTGTVMAYMLPYTLITGAVWIIFLVLWITFGLPMGPGYSALI
ncbi:MAG: AbgT family transporter [Anaerocolumna sp.]